MNLLIADDEPLARERLKSLVVDINPSIEISQASNGLEVLQQVSDFNPDIILLDIRMPEMDGIEAAQHLSNLENPPAIIFTTAYDQYTFEALDAQAIAYLLKPIRQELLEKALQHCQKLNRLQLQSLLQEDSYRTHISTKLVGNILLIPIENILYFQADHKYVVIKYQKDNQIKEAITEETLKSLELEFKGLFVRIHRNTLVQIKLIEALVKKESTLFLKLKGCDDLIDISRRHHASLRQLIG